MNINEISSSITHLEDLSTTDFIQVINKIDEHEITEKVDGAQILFGIDEKGLYTSRETKGGSRVYEATDYAIGFSNTYMRSTHLLLKRVFPLLKEAGMRKGDQIEAEVLFGELPNVVPYSEDKSFLIFLRTTAGNISIDTLKEHLGGKSFTVCIDRPVTPDGRTISLVEDINIWEFARVPKIAVDSDLIKKEIKAPMLSMRSYLRQNSGILNIPNATIESTPLNKCPSWCESVDWKLYKDLVKEKKQEIHKVINEGYVAQIKHILLNNIVRNRASVFGPLLENGGWIEGVVLKHRSTGNTVKLVDKAVFGAIREFAWNVRNTLTESARSTDNASSFLGKLHLNMAIAIGHPELGTMQAKNYLRKAGNTTEERITRLAESVDTESVRDYWLSLLEQKMSDLCHNLNKYEKEKYKRVMSIPESEGNAKFNISYNNPSIDRRTKETFASLFERISLYISLTERAVSVNDLIQIIVGKQLADLS